MRLNLIYPLAIIATVSLTGCGVTGNAVESKKGTLEVSEKNDVDKDDYFFSVSSSVPFTVMELTSGAINMGVPLDFKYHGYTFGDADLKFVYPLQVAEQHPFSFEDEPLTNDVSKLQARINYSYPVYSFYTPKEEVSISFGEIDGMSYYGIVPSRFLNTINVRGGFMKDYSRTQTQAHNDYLKETYDDLALFTQDNAIVRQSMKYAKLGVSFQRFVNTSLEGTGDGKDFSGHLSSLVTIYLDVNYLISSNVDLVYTRYTAYEPGTYTIIDEHDGEFDLSTVMPKQKIGINFGLEYTNIGGKKHNSFFTQGFEFGVKPGYFGTSMDGFYISYAIKYGIGKISK